MIKHWEILENKWTKNSAYVLGIQGDDSDSQLILRELSSFCSLIDVKVSNLTHLFELINVNDDDILQKIRTKVDEIAQRSSMSKKDVSLSSTPLQVSGGTLDFVAEGGEPFENILGSRDSSQGILSSSSDGREITLNGNASLHLEDTKTGAVPNLNQQFKQEEIKPAPVKAEEKVEPKIEQKEIVQKKSEEKPAKKEEKVGFFKRLFSFGKKKEPVKEQAVVSGPLPIEQIAAKTDKIAKKETKISTSNKLKGTDKAAQNANMHGVVIKGTSFPAKELGAQEVKDVPLNLDKEPLKEQSDVLKSQVPLDDIFAAETICQFYDDKNSSQQPKIEKIEEPTPMPTPRVITITQNKILEENLKQAAAKEEGKKQEQSEPKAKPQAPIIPPAKIVAKENLASAVEKPSDSKAPIVPATPILKDEKNEQQILQASAIAQKIITSEDKNVNLQNQNRENKTDMDLNKKDNKMPKINISEEEALQVKQAVEQERKAAAAKKEAKKPVAPKAPVAPVKEAVSKAAATPVAPQAPAAPVKEAVSKAAATPAAPQAPAAPVKEAVSKAAATPATPKAPTKPIPMPHVKQEQIDGFDHTIQTTSIPVYKKSNWPIEMPIVPSFTLDNMDMSSNRFAHAAAMSIVENPGTMYNPFFVFGEGGCGKTHFLNAVGAEFAKKISQDKIFITNGVRFSRGVQRAIENGTIDQVKEFLDSAQVLIIDDIHLTAVNETNKDFISQVLNDYVAKRKQLVISSKYPPQGLSRFEELTNFKLDQGWISELKPLRPNHFLKAYFKMALDAQVDLTEAQCRGFFGRENLTLGMIAKDIKRAKVLSRRIKDSGSISISYEQLLNYITAITGEDSTSQLESLDLTSPLSIRRGENTNWGNFGFFFPKESADKFKWIVYATMQRAKELGIKGGFNFALKSAYSTEHIIASAFKIANVCDSKNLKAAIILGPDPKIIQPAIRDNFCDILTHMLEVMMIRCAIIPYEDIKKPSSYVKVLGDVLK